MREYTLEEIHEFLLNRTIALTQKQVAKETGFRAQYLSDVLAGRRPLTKNLAAALGFRRLPSRYALMVKPRKRG